MKKFPLIAILKALIPAVSKTAEAMRKSSPGGKKITQEELADISLTLAGDIMAVLETI